MKELELEFRLESVCGLPRNLYLRKNYVLFFLKSFCLFERPGRGLREGERQEREKGEGRGGGEGKEKEKKMMKKNERERMH